jgi:acetolactate synthase-1/3 small subunit
MIDAATIANRAGYSDAPRGSERIHILTVIVEDRPGAIDRVVGVLRRKRAHTQSLALSPSGTPEVVRITALVKDVDVSVENLVEHLRKIIDVRQITNLTSEQALIRELALVQVNATPENQHEIIEAASQFGAAVVAATSDVLTFEVSGSEEKLARFFSVLEPFGVRDVVRSGAIALTR